MIVAAGSAIGTIYAEFAVSVPQAPDVVVQPLNGRPDQFDAEADDVKAQRLAERRPGCGGDPDTHVIAKRCSCWVMVKGNPIEPDMEAVPVVSVAEVHPKVLMTPTVQTDLALTVIACPSEFVQLLNVGPASAPAELSVIA